MLPRSCAVLILLAAASQLSAQEAPRPVPPTTPPTKGAQTPPANAQPTTEELVKRILTMLDKNNDGKISRAEAKGTPLEVVFERLDTNHDGFLDRDELMHGRGIMAKDSATPAPATKTPVSKPAAPMPAPSVTTSKAPPLPAGMREVVRDDVRLFLKQYDTNRDGKIDLDEFRTVFQDVDTNRDGLADKAELRQAAEKLFAAGNPPAPSATRSPAEAAPAPLSSPTTPDHSPQPQAALGNTRPASAAPKEVKATTLDIMILHLVRHYDVDKDGKLDWAEAQALFRAMDRNHDGALDADEMLQGILALWAPAPETPEVSTSRAPRPSAAPSTRRATPDATALADAFLRRYDLNHDGHLDPLEWKALFEQLDTNRRGTLSRTELRRLFVQVLGGEDVSATSAASDTDAISPEGRVSFVLSMYDTNGDGRISAEEAVSTPLAAIFKQLDQDGDGYLSRAELLKGVKLLPIPTHGSTPAPRTPRRLPR